MMTRQALVHRLPARAPDDVQALTQAIESGMIEPACIAGILGKTEGNGCVNDFSRGLAAQALTQELLRHVDAKSVANVSLVMSGGTEGALSPHFTAFEVRPSSDAPDAGALAIGRAHTHALPVQDLGRIAQVRCVADGVRAAMADAGITKTADVHFVQIKCPLLTTQRMQAAEANGLALATRDTLKSMGLSRAASALGCAVALGELDIDALDDAMIGRDWSRYSTRASASAGSELLGHEILVLGTGTGWSGPLRIASCVMKDAIDIEPVRAALGRLGLSSAGQLSAAQGERVKAVLAKAEASSTGELRGRRHTMLNDSDISSTRHARAFVAGGLAGLIGHTEIYVSGGAEHQGPDGGGPVCIIAAAA